MKTSIKKKGKILKIEPSEYRIKNTFDKKKTNLQNIQESDFLNI